MANTVTVSKTQYEQLVRRVERLEKMLRSLIKKGKNALDIEPPYGSDEWWEWSNKKGMEEIKKGKGTVIRNKKELSLFFKNL